MKTLMLMDYEWMVKHTPQKEWIEGKGLFLWLAFFFTEMGAGIYLVSIFLNFRPGWLIGWLMSLVLGGTIHLGFLGNPRRAWRILSRPNTSELSRGLWVMFLFAAIGFFQVVPVVFSFLPWNGGHVIFKVIMGTLCILLISHGFLTMNVVRALSIWNSPMMVPLSLASGIWVGAQTVAFLVFHTHGDVVAAEMWARWSIIGFTSIFFMFLSGLLHSSKNTQLTLRNILRGTSSIYFYIGVLTIGLLIPIIITLVIWDKEVKALSSSILFLRFICVLLGDLMIRYNIMKNALYVPLI